jgi:anti-sigma B factor antagonist
MFDIKLIADKNEIVLEGRFDASQTDKAKEIFNQVTSTYSVDFTKLDYISSAGLSVLLMTQKRLSESGSQLKLYNMSNHIKEIFNYAGFDMIFEIE